MFGRGVYHQSLWLREGYEGQRHISVTREVAASQTSVTETEFKLSFRCIF